MKITRWGAVALGTLAAVAVAGPAAAQVNPPQMQDGPALEVLAEHDGLTVMQAPCEDGGQITITAVGIAYHVSSGTRTAGLSARIGEQAVAQLQEPGAADGAHAADELITLDAPEADGVLEYRWFAGPDRTDLPAWTTGPADPGWADVVAAIVALEELEERYWDARDDGPWITWHEVDVTGCPAPSPNPEATATPTPTPGASEGPAPGAGGEQLPQTGVSTGVIALGGAALVVAGGGLVALARRRRAVGSQA